jgi:hypothetical protein
MIRSGEITAGEHSLPRGLISFHSQKFFLNLLLPGSFSAAPDPKMGITPGEGFLSPAQAQEKG